MCSVAVDNRVMPGEKDLDVVGFHSLIRSFSSNSLSLFLSGFFFFLFFCCFFFCDLY